MEIPGAFASSPFFMAAFGAVVALGFIIFVLVYFVLKGVGIKNSFDPVATREKCRECTLADQLAHVVPCKSHSGLISRVISLESWRAEHLHDYRVLRERLDCLERE
jgi:hypothetical protein